MPTHLRLLPALAAALLTARAAHAAAPWEGAPLSADPAAVRAAAAALQSPPGAPLDVLLEEGVYRLDAQGAVAQTYRLVYRPMSAEAARASARVERAWAPWSEGRPEIRARVVAADGVFTLDPATLVEGPVEDPGGPPSARRELSGTIPGVRAGAVVEQVVTGRETAFVAGTVLRFRLGGVSPARLVRLRIEAPAALPLRFAVRGLELAPVETVANGVRTLVFERRDASGTPPREPGAPPELAPAPYVAFAAGQTWADVAGRVRAVLEGAIAGADLRGEARAALGAGRPKREEAVRRISAFLRARVHSTGVPVDEAPLAPRKPAEVLAKGEGDAMDLAALWVALLRAAGLEAEVALASTEWSDLPREVPGLGVFDRALVHVGGKGGAIWLDPSSPRLAPGALPLELQGKLALVAARGTRDLVRTPASGPADNAALTVRELHLAELGRGRVVETRELSGALAASEREFRARIPADHRDRMDERYAREVLRAGTFLGAEVRNLDDPSAPLAVRVEADESALAETGDEDALVPVGAAPVLEPLPAFLTAAREGEAAPSPRRDDVALSLPYRWEIRYRVFPPDGFRARRLPEDGVERFGPATLTRRFAAGKDGTVTATYVFDTGGRRLAAADADTLAARARALAGGEPERIALERTASALLADGQVKEGLAELRRLCAAHPREAMHPLHLALALLELGDGEGAAEEARRGIALEPARAWGYRVLGWILEHDAVGRRFGHGYDRAGALAAYRRAAELDPRHAGGRAALAELLSRGAAGVRLGPGADVGAALAEYEALRSDAGAGPYDAGLLPALFAAGRHADALALARGLTPSPERNAILVAAAAVLRGAKPAEAEADALGDDGRTALRDAASLLARDRRYPLAAALARSAARGARDADEVASFADLLASLRPWKEVAAQGDDTARLAKAVVVTALTSPDPARELEPLLSTRAVGPARAALLGGLSAPLGAVRRSLREAGVTPDLLLDVALSGLELFRDGDPATGARLRLRFAAAPGERATSLYVVREGGALRLLASEAAWPILGAEARRAAEAGDLALAARWLAWAREDAPGSVGDPGTPAGLLAALAPAGAP
ncbi:DUF3857 domain-containing protein, partial [Anaeromyxobacter terrae]|uniref:DUF3857 domain-containing protein n=1 Tax=Anaeromyxobacter terrae TaxID=2925406 RepID=UPI001F5941C5